MYHQSQRGGEISMYRGGSQSGAGIGDILSGLGRALVPVELRGVSSFACHTLTGKQAGLSMKNAANAAVVPSLSAGVGFGSAGVIWSDW
jgi:hypothetical protein